MLEDRGVVLHRLLGLAVEPQERRNRRHLSLLRRIVPPRILVEWAASISTGARDWGCRRAKAPLNPEGAQACSHAFETRSSQRTQSILEGKELRGAADTIQPLGWAAGTTPTYFARGRIS